MNTKFIIHDLEVMPNAFVAGFKPLNGKVIIFEVSARKNQLEEMIDFITENYDKYFVGYNCNDYDEPILRAIVKEWHDGACVDWHEPIMWMEITDFIKKKSDEIIGQERTFHKKKDRLFPTIDLMTMLFSQNLRVGLKPLQVSMCYPNVEEMNINWNDWVDNITLDKIITYNHNDLGSTEHLLKMLKSDLSLRLNIKKNYGIDCLSKDGVGVGVDIFTKYICANLGLQYPSHLKNFRQNLDIIYVKDLILPEIQFKTKAFSKVLDDFKSMVLDRSGSIIALRGKRIIQKKSKSKKESKETEIIGRIGKITHTFGLGGLHAQNDPIVVEAKDGYRIIDADVASMYPSMSDSWSFGPAGFKEAFVDTIRLLKAERLIAKRGGDKTKDKTLKLALNSILGHLRNEYGPYFAPEANTAICVNGQLFLAMLIEELESAGIEVFSSNTDGVTSRVHESQLDKYYTICKKWETLSRLELEYVEYEKIVMTGVNSYVAFKKPTDEELAKNPNAKGFSDVKFDYDYSTPDKVLEYNYSMLKIDDATSTMLEYEKQKGEFIVYPRVGKGLDSLIVAKALINYYGRGIPVEETITNVKSIYDYAIYQKVGKQFKVMVGDEEIQHISRFYVKKGGYGLRKVSKDGAKESSIIKGWGVGIINDLRDTKLEDFKIDFKYYIRRAYEVISKINLNTNQTTLF